MRVAFVTILFALTIVVRSLAQSSQEINIGNSRIIIQASPVSDNSTQIPLDANRVRLGLEVGGCTENCPAEDADRTTVSGPIVDSESLGSSDSDMVRSSGKARAKLVKNACGCDVCPCGSGRAPISSALSSSNRGEDLPTTVVRVGLDGQLVDEGVDILPANCGCTGCPACNAPYLPPDERKFLAKMIMAKRTREEREKQRKTLMGELEDYSSTLSEIGKLQRALQFQYAELRRKHQNLRTEAAANKMAINNMGGDDSLKGSDFDIEGPIPRTVEDLDKIIESAVTNPKASSNEQVAEAAEILETLKNAVKKSDREKCRIVRKAMAKTKKSIREFLGAQNLPVTAAEQLIGNLKLCESNQVAEQANEQIKQAITQDKQRIAAEALASASVPPNPQQAAQQNINNVLQGGARF